MTMLDLCVKVYTHRVPAFAGRSRITAPVLRSALMVINLFGIPELKNILVFLEALQFLTQEARCEGELTVTSRRNQIIDKGILIVSTPF